MEDKSTLSVPAMEAESRSRKFSGARAGIFPSGDRVAITDLNAAKSTFRPGPPYRSQIRTYERQADGMKTRIKTTYADGHVTDVEFTAAYDSLEYPVTGSPEYDSIKLKKVDASTSEAVLGHAGKVFATARRILSEDGMRMTIVYQTNPSEGTTVNNVMVYEKLK